MSEQVNESSHHDHERLTTDVRPLGFAVITLSDTRTELTDKSGQHIRTVVAETRHVVARYAVVRDEPKSVRAELESALSDSAVDIIVTNGGTGIALRDTAYETIADVLEKRLDGFGELFRMLSYAEIGSAAMLSRASAGIARGKVVFSLPGSTNAVRLGMRQLILPQVTHLYQELHKPS